MCWYIYFISGQYKFPILGDLSGNWEMWLQDEDVQDESVIPQETGDTQMVSVLGAEQRKAADESI